MHRICRQDFTTGLVLAQGKRGVEVWGVVKALTGPEVGRSAYYNFQKDWLEIHEPDDPTEDK